MTYREQQRLSDIAAALAAIWRIATSNPHAILQVTLDHDLPELKDAAARLLDRQT